MALSFAVNSTDRVDCGSAAGIDNLVAWSMCGWAYITDLGVFSRFMSKGDDVKEVMFGGSAGNTRLRQARPTNATAVENGAFPLNSWRFFAGTYDGTDGPRLFRGSLTARVTEVSYSQRDTGSGAETSDAANSLWIGNRPTGTANRAPAGRIANACFINRRLTLGELGRLQFRLLPDADTLGLWHLGFNGTGTQPDLSGHGNNGSVTGAAVADHVPLGAPFGFDLGWQGAFTTAAAAATSLILPRRLNILLRM